MNYGTKQLVGFGIASFIPLLAVVLGVYYGKDLVTGFVFGFVAIPFAVMIGKYYIQNPWTQWLEGKSLLGLDLASPGKIRAYSVIVDLPYIKMKHGKEWILSLFNRSIASYLMKPVKIGATRDNDSIYMNVPKLDEEAITNYNKVSLNKNDFVDKHFTLEGTGAPMLIFNSKTKSFLTKEMLNTMETTLMVEHLALLLAEQMKLLRNTARQLSKNVVDLIMPNKFGELLANPYFRILIIGVVLFFIIMLAAPMLPKMTGYVVEAGNKLPGSPVALIRGF